LLDAGSSANPAAAGVALATILVIVGCKRIHVALPGMLIAVTVASVVAAILNLPVETIGSRFGGIPRTLPLPALPDITPAKLQAVLPDALAFALLGAIESLLSAVVADGMTGRRHRSNCELVGQGIANVASGLFGGICVTGTIARTATNVRSGARGPVAGMLHALFLLLFMLLAAALAGVLAVVAWSMAEKYAFLTIARTGGGDALVLLATFALTVFRDLVEGIIVGVALGSILLINRMAEAANIETHAPLVSADQADGRGEMPYDPAQAADSDIVVYRITGAFFFAAASTIGSVLDRIADTHRAFIVDFSAASFVDSTAAKTVEAMARKARRHGVKLLITGTTPEIRRELFVNGVKPPLATYKQTLADGLKAARRETANA